MHTTAFTALLALATPIVQDSDQLRTHLCSGESSPLDRLSRGARLRLLENLQFRPGGTHTAYPPLAVDLTTEEKNRIVELLGLEAYREWPRAQLSISAGHDSHGYPFQGGAYCAGTASLADWAEMARARDEGALSAEIARFSGRVSELVGANASFEVTGPAIAAAAEPTLRLIDDEPWVGRADNWVLRDAVSQLSFAATLSEDQALIDAALQLGTAANETAGIEFDDGELLTLQESLRTQVPGKRRIGRLQPSGSLLIEDVGTTPRLVLVSGAGCGFSRDMLSRMAEDDDLAGLAIQHLTVLAPARQFNDSSLFEHWNATHPAVAYQAWILRSEWPEIDLNTTPVLFEFTEDGARRVFQGFPSDEAEERLDILRNLMSGFGKEPEG